MTEPSELTAENKLFFKMTICTRELRPTIHFPWKLPRVPTITMTTARYMVIGQAQAFCTLYKLVNPDGYTDEITIIVDAR